MASGAVKARHAAGADIPLLTRWRSHFAAETLGDTDTQQLRDRIRRGYEQKLSEDTVWILEADGRPVSTTTFNARLPQAVQASLLEAREQGAARGILFTDEGNVAAQRAYEALGFEPIGAYRLLLLRDEILL